MLAAPRRPLRRVSLPAAVLLAIGPLTASCAQPSPRFVQPRVHHTIMQQRAVAFCEPFGGEPKLVDWRQRSNFGKLGGYRLETLWICEEAD